MNKIILPALAFAVSIFLGNPVQAENLPLYHKPTKSAEAGETECDVLVYGGTPGGVTSAIQAARLGKEVFLLSFDQHVGGMTSGGLTATDLGREESIGGMALEFYSRLGKSSNFSPLAQRRFSERC